MDESTRASAPTAMHFDARYIERAQLPDGTAVTLRLVVAQDKALLRRGFERLSPESRHQRFFTAKRELSEAELRYFTELDGDHHFAIGATRRTSDGDEEGLGIARFVRIAAELRVAEAAVAVVDAWQGRGLGRLLLARLVAAARERGVTTFRVSLLADNTAVRALIDDAGEATHLAGGNGAIVVDVPLPDVPPLESSLPRTGALYRIFRGAARGVVAAFGSRRT
jgi:GNAT superfamily N-acetyltransferase